MAYTLGQAAKATGKSKPAIFDQIKKGRISAQKNELGRYEIDPSELHRLYPPVSQDDQKGKDGLNAGEHPNGPEIKALAARLEVMEELVSALRDDKAKAEGREAEAIRRETEAAKREDDLRRDLEHWRGFAFEAQQRLKQLEAPRREPEPTFTVEEPPIVLHPQNEQPKPKKGGNPFNPFTWFGLMVL